MKMKTGLLKSAWSRLAANHTFVIACHVNPDGDAIGSSLALSRVLRALGKDVTVICEGGVPDSYDYIPGREEVLDNTSRRGFDVGLLVDCEGLARAGTAAEAVSSARTTACIDHHIPDDGFGDIRIVDQTASSTAELVLQVLDANGVRIDSTAAMQLMIGVVNDTGGFRFGNTTVRTFKAAARLTELGADASYAARCIYETRSAAALRLLGRALASLQTCAGGRVVWAVVTQKDIDELGASHSDTDGIVNQVAYARGAVVAMLFREIAADEIRVSLRSREGFDVNRVARAFGGGGHAAAAGCTLRMPLDAARDQILREVGRWMEF